jgi:hypothetical protein
MIVSVLKKSSLETSVYECPFSIEFKEKEKASTKH